MHENAVHVHKNTGHIQVSRVSRIMNITYIMPFKGFLVVDMSTGIVQR